MHKLILIRLHAMNTLYRTDGRLCAPLCDSDYWRADCPGRCHLWSDRHWFCMQMGMQRYVHWRWQWPHGSWFILHQHNGGRRRRHCTVWAKFAITSCFVATPAAPPRGFVVKRKRFRFGGFANAIACTHFPWIKRKCGRLSFTWSFFPKSFSFVDENRKAWVRLHLIQAKTLFWLICPVGRRL